MGARAETVDRTTCPQVSAILPVASVSYRGAANVGHRLCQCGQRRLVGDIAPRERAPSVGRSTTSAKGVATGRRGAISPSSAPLNPSAAAPPQSRAPQARPKARHGLASRRGDRRGLWRGMPVGADGVCRLLTCCGGRWWVWAVPVGGTVIDTARDDDRLPRPGRQGHAISSSAVLIALRRVWRGHPV